MSDLTSADHLESVVGARTAAGELKSIPSLDEHCVAFLAHSTFAVVGFRREDGSQGSLPVGGDPGASHALDPDHLALPLRDDLAKQEGVVDGAPAGLVALVPGYGETLRVNGRIRLPDDRDTAVLDVEEAFLHCAKCMLRSKLWTGPVTEAGRDGADPNAADPTTTEPVTGDLTTPAIAEFLARSPFLTLTTTDASGRSDVSPKGDPAGFVAVLDAHTLAVPDRPGNRRTDTLHNLLERPEIALAAFVPGDDRVLRISGRARITDDEETRALMEVKGNVPKAAIVIDVEDAELRAQEALASSRLWDRTRQVPAGTLPRASQIWTDHVKSHEGGGIGSKLAKAVANERLLRAGLAADYRTNLY